MNEQNYASLEASKRLHDAGIVLETDAVWADIPIKGKFILRGRILCGKPMKINDCCIPAPTMIEVWRELPHDITYNTMVCSLMIWKFNKGKYTEVGYWWHDEIVKSFLSENPADALIDLLIWCKKEGVHEP